MKSFMNEEEIQKSIEKIKMYKNSEDIIFDKIKKEFARVNYYYLSNNTEKLNSLELEYCNKLAKIKKVHNNNITVLARNLTKYKETKTVVENMFNNRGM